MTSEAGWYPDPNGRHELRYWDGSAWSEHVSDDGVASTDPVGDATQANRTLADQAVGGAEPAGTRFLPIGLGIAGVVAVIGGLFYFLGDGDGSSATSASAVLSSDSATADFTVSVGANEAIRFLVTPEGDEADELDLALVLAADQGDAVSMSKAIMGEQADGLDDDEILDQFGLDSLETNNFAELAEHGIDTDLIMLGYRDDNGSGEPEADFFAAPDDVDLHVITFDLAFGEGEVGFESEDFNRDIDVESEVDFDDEWFSDPSFYGEGFTGVFPFALGASLFGDMFDELPGAPGDLQDELDGLLEDLPEDLKDLDPDEYLGDLEDELDGMFEDLPEEFDSMFDELTKDLEEFNAEDYFGEGGSGLEEFLDDFLEDQN